MALALAAAVLAIPFAARAADIRIGGTGNALGSMRLLGEAFARVHPESRAVVLDSIGSSGAIKAVAKKAIEIGLSSRPLTEDEIRGGLTAIEYASTPTVFAVHSGGKVTSITIQQVADIYTGKTLNWPDGKPIRPVMRQAGDDNSNQIRQLSPVIKESLAIAETRPGLIFAANDQEAADKMESAAGSIGVTTLALIRSEKRKLSALQLDGVEPTPENAQAGRYPMLKRFYFILPKEPVPAAKAFLAFVRSAQGRKILEQTGHIVP